MTTPSTIKETKERQEVLRNDQKVREEQGATMHGFAMAEMAQSRGRFGEAEGKQYVVGSTPGPAYPRLPGSSPWHGPDPVGLEPPLGSDINFVEACGTAVEIEASLRALASPTGFASPVVTGPAPDAPPLVDSGEQRGVGPFSPSKEKPHE
jgi:hypothetical protein